MTQYQPDDKNRIKRQKSEQAIRLAKEGRWDEAVQVNQDLLGIFPDDAEALNRLGKALMELKRYTEATTSYERAVKNDPSNMIAQKNLQRLRQLVTAAPTISAQPTSSTPPPTRPRVAPSLFIEETGKTGVTNLANLADSVILARLTGGDPVYLEADIPNQVLRVKNEEGQILGQIEPRLGLRLLRFIGAGNRYIAAVQAVGEKILRIVIQETYQHPSQRGKMSFPPKTGGAGYRAYIKEGVRERYDEEDYENDNDTEEVEETDTDEDEQEGEPSDDFGDTTDDTEEI